MKLWREKKTETNDPGGKDISLTTRNRETILVDRVLATQSKMAAHWSQIFWNSQTHENRVLVSLQR